MAHGPTLQTYTCIPTPGIRVYSAEVVSHRQDLSSKVTRGEHFTPHHPLRSTTGHILGPILYWIYTADLPETEHTMTATYADDTAILASHQNHIADSINLQRHIHQLEMCLKRWRIKANEKNRLTLPSP